jgi:hypothetical protein
VPAVFSISRFAASVAVSRSYVSIRQHTSGEFTISRLAVYSSAFCVSICTFVQVKQKAKRVPRLAVSVAVSVVASVPVYPLAPPLSPSLQSPISHAYAVQFHALSHKPLSQYLHFCTSKARKVSTCRTRHRRAPAYPASGYRTRSPPSARGTSPTGPLACAFALEFALLY